MSSFGSELRRERTQRGVSLEEISATTRVAVRYYKALEEDDFKALPGGVFDRGIVRGYANRLGLDETETLNRFLNACGQQGIDNKSEAAWGEFAKNVSKQRSGQRSANLRWLGVLVMMLAVAALGFGVYRYLQKRGLEKPHLIESIFSR